MQYFVLIILKIQAAFNRRMVLVLENHFMDLDAWLFYWFLQYIMPRSSTPKKMKREVRPLTARTPTWDNTGTILLF